MTKLIAAAGLAFVLAGCASGPSQLDTQRTWCHSKGGYVANTGWYQWSCVIGDRVLPLPSPGENP